jgi:hypothetical protein
LNWIISRLPLGGGTGLSMSPVIMSPDMPASPSAGRPGCCTSVPYSPPEAPLRRDGRLLASCGYAVVNWDDNTRGLVGTGLTGNTLGCHRTEAEQDP